MAFTNPHTSRYFENIQDDGFDWSSLIGIISQIAGNAIRQKKAQGVKVSGERGDLLARYMELAHGTSKPVQVQPETKKTTPAQQAQPTKPVAHGPAKKSAIDFITNQLGGSTFSCTPYG